MKKSAVVAIILAFGLVCGAIGAGAATGIQQIKAALNHNLKFTVDNESWTPKDGSGNKMSPIVYKGSTYLPARAVAEALGAEINLVGNTIAISSNNADQADGIPYNDAEPLASSKPAAEKPSTQSGAMKYVGSESDMEARMKNEAVKVLHLLGQAFKEGKPDKVVNYISSNVSSPIPNSPLDLGKPYYLDEFKAYFKATLSKNDPDVVSDYAAALQAASLENVKTNHISEKSEYSQWFTFSHYPEGFDVNSSIYLYFGFYADKYDSKNFLLGELRFG